jgi:hypothetical protein
VNPAVESVANGELGAFAPVTFIGTGFTGTGFIGTELASEEFVGAEFEGTESISVALICDGEDGAGASMSGMEARDGGGSGRPDDERAPVREGGVGAPEGRPAARDGGGGATLGPNGMVRGGGRGALMRPTEGAVVVGALFASVFGTEAWLLSSVMIDCNPTQSAHTTPVVCARFATPDVSRHLLQSRTLQRLTLAVAAARQRTFFGWALHFA